MQDFFNSKIGVENFGDSSSKETNSFPNVYSENKTDSDNMGNNEPKIFSPEDQEIFPNLSPSQVELLAEKLYKFVQEKYLSSNKNLQKLIENIWFDPSFARNHHWDKTGIGRTENKNDFIDRIQSEEKNELGRFYTIINKFTKSKTDDDKETIPYYYRILFEKYWKLMNCYLY